MTQEQAVQKATEMLASGQYDKAAAAPSTNGWVVQARTKDGRDVEIH